MPAFFDAPVSDPGKQFDLVAHHMQSIRRLPGFEASRFIIYVERNLGFEAGVSCQVLFAPDSSISIVFCCAEYSFKYLSLHA